MFKIENRWMDFDETWNDSKDHKELVPLYFDLIATATEPLEFRS